MTKQEIYDEFWASVPEDEKPEVLAMFYGDMTDKQKDQFIQETCELVSNMKSSFYDKNIIYFGTMANDIKNNKGNVKK